MLEGTKGPVIGIAEDLPIAWGCPGLRGSGAELAISYLEGEDEA